MLLAVPLYLACLCIVLAPVDLRSKMLPALALPVLLVLYYILYSDAILVKSDYTAYYATYLASKQGVPDSRLEPMFLMLLHLLSTAGLDFRFVVALFAVFTLSCLYLFLKHTFAAGDVPLLLVLYFNFFLLYNLMFNLLRQGLAASLVLVAAAQILHKKYMTAAALILISSALHRSSLACLLMLFPALSKRVTLPLLLVLFVAAFAGSRSGLNENFSSVLGGVGFAEDTWNLYYQNPEFRENYPQVNRLDFFVFSLVPIVLFYVVRYVTSFSYKERQAANYEATLKIYMTLMMPLAFFAFLPYSDRLAVYGWMMWPAVTAWPVLFIFNSRSAENLMARLFVAVVLVGFPIVIQYQDNLFTVAVAVQDAILGPTF